MISIFRGLFKIFFSKKLPQIIFSFLTIYIALFAAGIARYELSLFTLHNQISNLVAMSSGENYRYALGRIPKLQNVPIPIEPKIDNPISVLKSIYYKYDKVNFEAYEDLYELLVLNKNNLSNLNLNGLWLPDFSFTANRYSKSDKWSYDLSGVEIENTSFTKANFIYTLFKKTKFINVDFGLANMPGVDLAFAVFKNSYLLGANLVGSNLCGVQFIDTLYFDADFSDANLMGADLSNMIFNTTGPKLQPELQGALYNSKKYVIRSIPPEFKRYGCRESAAPLYELPPTKFPEGFDPEENGMIDISKLGGALTKINKNKAAQE